MSKKQKHPSSHAITGFLLVIIGGLFLLDSLNILHFGHFVAGWWPLILIIIGISQFKNKQQSGGTILIFMGVLFLSATLDIINWGSIWRFWPVVLIIVGLQILLKAKGHSSLFHKLGKKVNENYFNLSGIFGGGDHQIVSQSLEGGEALAIFGGLDIDCGTANPTDECVFTFTAIFGGIEIRVPKDWQVITTGTPLFGNITNKSGSGDGHATKTVRINGTVLFGSIEIKT